MKNYFGLFLLVLSFNVAADTQKALTLRGFVVEKVSIKVNLDRGQPNVEVVTNALHNHIDPKVNFSTKKNSYIVAVIQP